MSFLNDEINIRDLSIPGTHNSASSKFIDNNNEEVQFRMINQVWTIKEQLYCGIRYFDLRIGGNFMIYHSVYSTIFSFNDTMKIFDNFLKENPNEFLFVRFQFYNFTCFNLNIHKCYVKYIKSVFDDNYHLFYLQKEFPEIKFIRGKIYPFIEYFKYQNFTDWHEAQKEKIYLQDIFDFKGMNSINRPYYLTKKREYILHYLNTDFIDSKKERLIINHCSMKNKKIKATSVFVSFITNEVVFKNKKIRGIVIFDYPSEELVKHVIDANFHKDI
jgi:hypothetical protein